MKTLYIVRHAKSSWSNPGLDDIDRPLNKRGLKDAPKMARFFAEPKPKVDLIISSPARRALETAENFASELNYKINRIQIEESVYDASPNTLLQVLFECEDIFKKVMLFGHNPGLLEFINQLSPSKIEKLPTCTICCLTFSTKRWYKIEKDNCEFKFIATPKKIEKK
ncbi:MAG: histidine phosphatase family protein [Victivallales bacterium]|nr:histidine phosphatase family protein [Victivallales bacterium]